MATVGDIAEGAGADWRRVTHASPCPVCGRDSWCTTDATDGTVKCMRVESGEKVEAGGWLHRTGQQRFQPPPNSRLKPRRDWQQLTEQHQAGATAKVDELATMLGVDPKALHEMRVGWDGEAWTFPMHSADGAVCGIRRRFSDGRKRAVPGTANGIFRRHPPDDGLLLVCEGESDCAAALSLGLDAVAVPGAGQCLDAVVACALGRDAVIMADGDEVGARAAEKMEARLAGKAKSVRTIVPPAGLKDLRAWVQAGATAADVRDAIDDVRPRPDTFSGRWLPVDPTWLEQEPPPQRWLVKWPGEFGMAGDGLAPRGIVALLGGAGGIGKTEVATGLAVAALTRTPWLGYFHIADSAGKVLLLAAEEDEPQMRRTLHRLTRGLTASHREEMYHRLVVAPMHGRSVALLHKASSKANPTPSAVVDELRARLDAGAGSDGWAAVIVGPLSRLAGVSTDGDNEAATALIQQLEKLTEVAGNPMVLVDCHTNAASREEGKRAKVRGATGLVDGPRLTLLMSKRDGFVELEIGKTNRGADGKAPLKLERRGGILQVAGSVSAEDAEKARAARDQARVEAFERKVSRAIEEVGKVTPKSISKEALVGIIGGNVNDTRRAIEVAAARSLENVGTVLRPRYVLPGTDAHLHAQKKGPKKTGRDRDPPTRPKSTKSRKGRDGRDGRDAEGAA